VSVLAVPCSHNYPGRQPRWPKASRPAGRLGRPNQNTPALPKQFLMARFVMARRPGCRRQPVCEVCVGRESNCPFRPACTPSPAADRLAHSPIGVALHCLGRGKTNAVGAHNAIVPPPAVTTPVHGHEFPALTKQCAYSTQYIGTAPRGCISLQPPVASHWVMPSKRNMSPVCREPRGHGQSPEYRSETSGGQTGSNSPLRPFPR
jgi:hypothetical protein